MARRVARRRSRARGPWALRMGLGKEHFFNLKWTKIWAVTPPRLVEEGAVCEAGFLGAGMLNTTPVLGSTLFRILGRRVKAQV